VDQKTSVTKWGDQHLKCIKEMIAGKTCIVRVHCEPKDCDDSCRHEHGNINVNSSAWSGALPALNEDGRLQCRKYKWSVGTKHLSGFGSCVVCDLSRIFISIAYHQYFKAKLRKLRISVLERILEIQKVFKKPCYEITAPIVVDTGLTTNFGIR